MALVGFISDSHGEWLRTRVAVDMLRQYGCDTLIHLGDVETQAVLDELADNYVSMVFGNCDFVSKLEDYAVQLGIDLHHPAGIIKIDGMRIGFLHGDDIAQYHRFLNDPKIDIVAHGHSHETRDEMVYNTRCINPGALHRAVRYTVAVLDTQKETVTFLEVDDK